MSESMIIQLLNNISMAKKTISRLSVLAVLIVFLAACSKTSEYTNVIPADASVVASINLKSLASKAGLDDKENEAAKQKVLEALKSGMNAATFQQLEKVMKNPGESGIDVESPFYAPAHSIQRRQHLLLDHFCRPLINPTVGQYTAPPAGMSTSPPRQG